MRQLDEKAAHAARGRRDERPLALREPGRPGEGQGGPPVGEKGGGLPDVEPFRDPVELPCRGDGELCVAAGAAGGHGDRRPDPVGVHPGTGRDHGACDAVSEDEGEGPPDRVAAGRYDSGPDLGFDKRDRCVRDGDENLSRARLGRGLFDHLQHPGGAWALTDHGSHLDPPLFLPSPAGAGAV